MVRNVRCIISKQVDGNWAPWTLVKPCGGFCELNVTIFNRTCTDPIPRFGGDDCQGEAEMTESCNEFGREDPLRAAGNIYVGYPIGSLSSLLCSSLIIPYQRWRPLRGNSNP